METFVPDATLLRNTKIATATNNGTTPTANRFSNGKKRSTRLVFLSWRVEVELLRTGDVHHNVEQEELTSRQGSNHYASKN